ncbi:flagellar protein FlaG [Achromobacter spanius]|uniref:Flagellar protein n=1 Tax=Achromobacter spanius TaxID=217203 RepID=A0A2S0I6J9_9BURK|nr:flagellar protein FlaG [Achromobacter spanius]AVJ27659.1 flagellar protein [Achromobacter spanius]
MAVTPLAPAAFASLPVSTVIATPDPSSTAAPATASADSGASGGATSDQANAQKLPLDKALDEINEQMRAWSTHLQFEIDPDVHQVVVSVVDADSGDVIRTIPSESVLKIAKMIVNMQGNGIKTAA